MSSDQKSSNISDSSGYDGNDLIAEFRNMLLNGAIEGALQFSKENSLPIEKIKEVVVEIIHTFLDLGEYQNGIKVSKLFRYEGSANDELIIGEWKNLQNQKKFEDAAKWAIEQNMSSVECLRSARAAYEQYIKEGNIESATRMIEEYKLKKEELLAFTIDEFNNAYGTGDYLKAALLGEKFNFSRERTIQSSLKACVKALSDMDYKTAFKMIWEYKLLSNEIFKMIGETEGSKFTEEIYGKFVEPALNKGQYVSIVEFVECADLFNLNFDQISQKEFLQKFQTKVVFEHNSLLQNDKFSQAKYLRDSLNLMGKDLPRDLYNQIINSAEEFHNSCLIKCDLEMALSVKSEYGLYTNITTDSSNSEMLNALAKFIHKSLLKGSFQPVSSAVSEYRISETLFNTILVEGILSLFDRDLHKLGFKVFDSFEIKINDEETKTKIINKYKDLLRKKDYLLAVEFAIKFKLNRNFIEEAAYCAWEEKFTKKKYDEAFNIKTEYKIPKKRFHPLAKSVYFELMDAGEIRLAVSIRKIYRLPISLAEWFTEIIKLFFGI